MPVADHKIQFAGMIWLPMVTVVISVSQFL